MDGKIFTLRSSIDKTAYSIVKLLVKKGLKLSSAESCTGGLISAAITGISGSSEVFDEGVCTYANSAKMKYLGVPAETLEKYGAVSEQTAVAMAKGMAKQAGSDISVSVTGIAGPSGGTEEKPVGTVYVGLCINGQAQARLVYTDPLESDGNAREFIRLSTVLAALEWIEAELFKM
jgi:nicotinamide-nucleotide amidase